MALGDSITEGFCDPIVGSGEPWLGWADRLAAILDGHAKLQDGHLEFANLAVRGRRVRDVVADQVPRAIELRADLVSILIGGNDLMAPTADPDSLAAELETGVIALRDAGMDVLLATCFDPRVAFFLKPFRGRAAVYNGNLWSIARRHGTATVDLWGLRELQQRSMWAEDRIHLSARRSPAAGQSSGALARRARTSSSPARRRRAPRRPASARSAGCSGTRSLGSGRRLRRISSGDGIPPKLPRPIAITGA